MDKCTVDQRELKLGQRFTGTKVVYLF